MRFLKKLLLWFVIVIATIIALLYLFKVDNLLKAVSTIYLNGQVVVNNSILENLWQPDQPIPRADQIELQNHGNNLWFKNIYVRELPY